MEKGGKGKGKEKEKEVNYDPAIQSFGGLFRREIAKTGLQSAIEQQAAAFAVYSPELSDDLVARQISCKDEILAHSKRDKFTLHKNTIMLFTLRTLNTSVKELKKLELLFDFQSNLEDNMKQVPDMEDTIKAIPDIRNKFLTQKQLLVTSISETKVNFERNHNFFLFSLARSYKDLTDQPQQHDSIVQCNLRSLLVEKCRVETYLQGLLDVVAAMDIRIEIDACKNMSGLKSKHVRSREFVSQEGHTAFATKEEADKEVHDILELYSRIYEEFLAIPVFIGTKSEHEKFAGGLYSTSVVSFIPHTGHGVQGATSHCYGQNFAKMFEINFQNKIGGKDMVWQNSWAYSTKTIGVMAMVHGDDRGLVLPPKVAPIQVIVFPRLFKDFDTEAVYKACEEVVDSLRESGIRAQSDSRENYTDTGKFTEWRMKGVPLGIEIGSQSLAKNQMSAFRRDTGERIAYFARADMVKKVGELLDSIQSDLFKAASNKRDACIRVAKTWDEFTKALTNKKMILAPWCDEEDVEKDVKARTKGDIGAVCSPFEQPELTEGTLCFASGKPAKKWTYWGWSY